MDVRLMGRTGLRRAATGLNFFVLLTILSKTDPFPVCAGVISFDTVPQRSRNIAGIAPIADNGGTFRLRHFVGDGVAGDVNITDNTISNTGSRRIFAYQIDGDVLLDRNIITNAGKEGAFAGPTTGNVVAADNNVQGSGDFGFQFFNVDAGVTFQNNGVTTP